MSAEFGDNCDEEDKHSGGVKYTGEDQSEVKLYSHNAEEPHHYYYSVRLIPERSIDAPGRVLPRFEPVEYRSHESAVVCLGVVQTWI
jgi:hypothetical protein